jgi:hypothetical protein
MSWENQDLWTLDQDQIEAVSGGVSTVWRGFGVDIKLATNPDNGCVGLLMTSTSTGDQTVWVGVPNGHA